MKYHYPESHKYNHSLCGAIVPWQNLAMNPDFVECKHCIKLKSIEDQKLERMIKK